MIETVAIATFCDDIRHERGNKFSLMGCYGPEMILDSIPAVLPRICVQVLVSSPSGSAVSSVKLRAHLNEELIAETDVPHEHIETVMKGLQGKLDGEDGRANFSLFMVFSPLSIQEPSTLRISAEAQAGVLKAGHLNIRVRTESDAAF